MSILPRRFPGSSSVVAAAIGSTRKQCPYHDDNSIIRPQIAAKTSTCLENHGGGCFLRGGSLAKQAEKCPMPADDLDPQVAIG
jgi:hypothetical protein